MKNTNIDCSITQNNSPSTYTETIYTYFFLIIQITNIQNLSFVTFKYT